MVLCLPDFMVFGFMVFMIFGLQLYGFVSSWFYSCMFYGFMVLWFMILWFYGFMTLWFIGFKNIKFPFHVFDRYGSHIQYSQDFIRQVVGICRCPPFPKPITFCVSQILIFTKIIFWKDVWDSSVFLLCILVSTKIKIVGFVAWGRVQKSRNHRSEGSLVLP